MQGRSSLWLHKTSYGMFRGGSKGAEMGGSKWLGEEQMWRKKRDKGIKEVSCL